jgi:hypothetical protein
VIHGEAALLQTAGNERSDFLVIFHDQDSHDGRVETAGRVRNVLNSFGQLAKRSRALWGTGGQRGRLTQGVALPTIHEIQLDSCYAD